MEYIQKFHKGFNLDISKAVFQPDTYYKALNMSLVSKLGLSTGTLRNINGNELFISIPDCSNVVQILYIDTGAPSIDPDFDINGINITTTYSTNWREDIADLINADPSLAALGIKAAFNGEQVVIYSILDLNNILITSNITVVNNSSTNFAVDTAYVPAISAPKIMGWGSIRDSIFLFTTNETLENTGSYGQIWKLVYDKVFFTPKLTLLHNANTTVTLAHPIACPGAIVGNPEIPSVQKLYYTDNFNPPRSINTMDANTMALYPTELENTPDLTNSNNIVQEIILGGNLLTGSYQACIRLKKTLGAESRTQIVGNPIHITQPQETSASYIGYTGVGSGATASKSIRYRFYNLDTDYTRAEIIILYRSAIGAVPDINIVYEAPVPSDGVFDFIYTGNETKIPLTLDEFQAENLVFSTVKSIASKNNYLFYGNVKYGDFDVDFDTRAYRFPAGNAGTVTHGSTITYSAGQWDGTFVQDTSGNYNVVPVNTFSLADNHDAINPNQEPYDWNNYLYQSDGTTIGGEGANIKYSFHTETIYLDSHLITLSTGRGMATIARDSTTYSLSNPVSNDSDHPHVNTFRNFHSPYIGASIRGYQRDEIYRFGIIFYSKKGVPSFVHWIADIRMPHIWMPDLGSGTSTDRTLQFETCTNIGGDNYAGHSLGVQFEINNLDKIKEQISGYTIVRVKRDDVNRTILGQGAFYPAVYDSPGVDNHLLPNALGYDTFMEDISINVASINSPEFQFGNPPGFNATDEIDIVGVLDLVQDAQITDTTGVLVPRAYVHKNYTFNTTCNPITNPASNNPYTLVDVQSIDSANKVGEPFTFASTPTATIWNRSTINNTYYQGNASMGSKTLALYADFTDISNTGGGFANNDGVAQSTTEGKKLYIANYRRPLTVQYGGNSFNQRSTNEYISTGNYQVVTPITSTNTFVNYVYGGDTYICLYDNVKHFKNWIDHNGTYSLCLFLGRIFPVETSINIDLREDVNAAVLNKGELRGGFATNPQPYNTDFRMDVDEDFILNSVYSAENDVNLYFPKPDPYISTTKFDVRIHRSEIKTNGELVDSWGIFKEDNFIDVDTAQGELNNLIVHQDRLLSFQDKGVSVVSVNERVIMQDTSGAENRLGTGGVLERYDYISKIIGSRHQFSFVQSNDAVFFFDVNTKNIYKLTNNNPVQLSTAKGINTYLSSNLNGLIQVKDNPYLSKGVHGTYDYKYNEAIFTFKDTVKVSDSEWLVSVDSYSSGTLEVTTSAVTPREFTCTNPEDVVFVSYILGSEYITEEFTVIGLVGTTLQLYNAESQLDSSVTDVLLSCIELNSFTVAYNDFIDGFTSFYSYTPVVYINDGLNIFSPASGDNDLWIHDKGPYGLFYGTLYPSSVTVLLNPDPQLRKAWDSLMWKTLVKNASDLEVPNETFNSIMAYTDKQDTGLRSYPTDTYIIGHKKEEFWNMHGLRDRMTYSLTGAPTTVPGELPNTLVADIPFSERLRNPYLFCYLQYDNTNNNSLVLESLKVNFRQSSR